MRKGVLIIFMIVLFPISLALGFIISVLLFLFGLGTFVFKIFSTFFILAVIVTLYFKNYKMTIESLILTYLFSEYGLPTIGYKIIALIESLRIKIREI